MRTNTLIALWAAVLLALFTTPTHAKFKYSYGDIGYTHVDSDSVDASGATVELSYAALEFLHVKFGYSHLWDYEYNDNRKNNDIKVDSFRIGMGGNFTVHDKVDLVGVATWISNEQSGDRNNSDRGYQLEAGARVQALKPLELTPRILYLDNDDFEADVGFELGLVYKFYKKYSLRLRTRYFNDDKVKDIFAGVRYNF